MMGVNHRFRMARRAVRSHVRFPWPRPFNGRRTLRRCLRIWKETVLHYRCLTPASHADAHSAFGASVPYWRAGHSVKLPLARYDAIYIDLHSYDATYRFSVADGRRRKPRTDREQVAEVGRRKLVTIHCVGRITG